MVVGELCLLRCRRQSAKEVLSRKGQREAGVALSPSSCWNVEVTPKGIEALCDHRGQSEHQSWIECGSLGHQVLPQSWTPDRWAFM